MRRYLSAVRYASAVIGNSSSGIIEVPSFHVPTINIGDRQKGRVQAQSVINCPPETLAIIRAITLSQQAETLARCQAARNPYEGNNTALSIFTKILSVLEADNINLKKQFYEGDYRA